MRILFSLVFIACLSGCYEDTDVTMHEAGVYKGKVDEHALSAEEREAVLETRFMQVQTDR